MKIQKLKKCKECWTEFVQLNTIQKYCSYQCTSKNSKSPKPIVYKPKIIKPKKEKSDMVSSRKRVKTDWWSFAYNSSKIAKDQKKKYWYTFCEVCIRSDLPQETHHLVYRSEVPNHTHLNNIRNLIRVCKCCHDKFHEYKPMRLQYIESRGLVELFGSSIL